MVDRILKISVGASRKSTSWKTIELHLREFYDKLKTPLRTQETLDVYLGMPKSKQDNLKDNGGFVGGQLDGNRIVKNLRGRDVVTLDLDHCPAGATEKVKQAVMKLGCTYCIYSTRKHRPSAPRLRVILPTNRTMTVDEYEPVARKLASLMLPDMSWYDPTTFEVTRLMYYPTCSCDGEFVYAADTEHDFIDVDGVLLLYDDWHDISSWAVVPGVEAKQQKAAEAEDPTAKKGIIGAFCRTYSITEAIDTFLPDEYIPAGADRYSYAKGSTSGGAIVYDDKFLFSHHATDPCSGRLVNAFDLVRLHKFGELDEKAAPGCPVTKLPSTTAMRDFVREDEKTQAALAQERSANIQLAFEQSLDAKGMTAEPDFAKHMADHLAALDGVMFTTDVLKQTLSVAGVQLWYDEITHKFRSVGTEQAFGIPESSVGNAMPSVIDDLYRQAKVDRAGTTTISDRMGLIWRQNRVNPVTDMLQNGLWDGADRVSILLDELMQLPQDDSTSRFLVQRWLSQCVALARNSDRQPYGAEGVLVLVGGQGIGKTSLFRRLAVEPDWFNEGAVLNFRDKDTLIGATDSWISELGEMERTLRSDEGALKAFITKPSDTLRRPYERAAEMHARRTSFCGTLNSERFLRDDTGNRRFWTVPITHIDTDRLFSLSDDWFRQLWFQVYDTWLEAGTQSYRLTREEQKLLNARNATRMEELPGEEELLEILDPDLPEEQWTFASATELVKLAGVHMDARRFGRVVNNVIASGEFPGAERRKGAKGKRGFWLPIAKDIDLV